MRPGTLTNRPDTEQDLTCEDTPIRKDILPPPVPDFLMTQDTIDPLP